MEKGFWEQTFKGSNIEDEPASSHEGIDDSPTPLLAADEPILRIPASREAESSGKEPFPTSSDLPAFSGPIREMSVQIEATAPEPPPKVRDAGAGSTGLDLPPSFSNSTLVIGEQKEIPVSKPAPGGWGAGAGLFYREKAKSGPHKLSQLGDFLDNIWVNINLRAANQNPRTFVLCGASRGVGTTFISFHLALSLSQERNMNVLYVDANLDAPHQPFVIPNMDARPGMASFCAGHQSIDSVIQRTEYKNLSVVTSGARELTGTGNSGNGSKKGRSVKEFVDYCSAHFDATIIDAQPPMEHPSTITLAKAVDLTILISRYGVSRREVYQHTIDNLKENNIAIAGLIINERRYPVPEYVYKLLG